MGWELFEQGGLMMYPLTLCSVLALAISLERGLSLRRKRIIRPEIVGVVEHIQGPEDVGLAQSVCGQYEGPFAQVMRAGLDNRHLPQDEIRESILDQGRQEMGALQKGLVVLETVASVSPLLGLLGTVTGMMGTFDVITLFGTGNAKAMAGGISVALITTQTGLMVSIPGLYMSGFLSKRANNVKYRIAATGIYLKRFLQKEPIC